MRTLAAPHFERIDDPRSPSGVITRIDHDALVRVAEAGGCVLTLRPALGEFVPAGATLFEITGASARLDAKAAIRSIEFGLERTLDQDMAYGLRLLVDIAERSLSDGPFLDPTTAVQAIDRLHDCLRQLAPRSFPDGQYRDRAGEVRLVTPSMTWEDYVHLAFDEIRMAGAGSPQIARRLRAALEDLLAGSPGRPPVPAQAAAASVAGPASRRPCRSREHREATSLRKETQVELAKPRCDNATGAASGRRWMKFGW